MALLDFLSGLGANTGPVGGPRGVPSQIQGIDPNMALAGPQGAAGGIQPQQPGPQPMGGFLSLPGGDPSHAAMASQPGMGQAQGVPAGMMPEPQRKQPSGFRDFLGKLGDVLLMSNDLPAMYLPMQREREVGEAMAAFLGRDSGLAPLALADPQIAAQFYDRSREDKRFERTAGQGDRRIGVEEVDATTRRGQLYEASRHNQVGEELTARGQDKTSQMQTRLADLQSAEARAQREFEAAMARGDQAHAEKMLGMQQNFAASMAQLQAQLGAQAEGGGQQTVEALSADGTTKTSTTKKLPATPRVTDEGAYKALPSGATFIGPDGKSYRKP